MKQEVEERKQLEQQRKQVEKEEAKYIGEINKVKEILLITDNQDKLSQLNNKIEELQRQLFDVEQKKDDIIKRQNGKAGNVYIISNLGSFGENIFKVGMTRRLEPMDRVKELSDASVPFMFDVHSFIFSDDAVALEQKLHSILEKNRVNKINLRKEFFNVSIDELEKIVTEIDPTAEFNKTMIAEEYRQSQVV
ncbi:GIY-YIG nuclease family protein [Turicibacter sanguinis]|uniref:GIY-YIG nuclease family protein n=1 Tax=Turicibacter sanguinis TaxID=154288 RepID=UPI0029425F42|nr:GIY-YIG nuclease family protein [Turicibacter sanguinis]